MARVRPSSDECKGSSRWLFITPAGFVVCALTTVLGARTMCGLNRFNSYEMNRNSRRFKLSLVLRDGNTYTGCRGISSFNDSSSEQKKLMKIYNSCLNKQTFVQKPDKFNKNS